MTLRVTVLDLETNEEETKIPAGDYVLVTTAPCHLYHTQVFAGTHILTVKKVTAR